MKTEKKRRWSFFTYGILFLMICIFGITLYPDKFSVKEEKLETQSYIYMEPEVHFISNLTFYRGEKFLCVDLIKSATNCVVIDEGKYIETEQIGMKDVNIKISDDIGRIREISIRVSVIEYE